MVARRTTHDPDDVFRRDLARAHVVESAIAAELSELGLPALVPELRIEEVRFENHRDYDDAPDVLLDAGSGGRLEIKERKYPLADWSRAFDPMAVGSVYRWSRKTTIPIAVVIVSAVDEGRIVVPCSTMGQWSTIQLPRHHDGAEHSESYAAGRALWRTWDSLVEYLLSERAKRLRETEG